MCALLVAGCYKTELNQIDKEITTLTGTEVASLDTQLKNIRESLDNLPFLSIELKDYMVQLIATADDLQKRIDGVSQDIATLKAAVTEKNEGVQKELLSRLETAKSALETQLAATRAVIDALQQKYDSLENRTGELEDYAESQFATLDWVNATFATSARQEELIADVETVRSMLDGLSSITIQLSDGIKSFIDTEVKAAKDSVDAEIAAMVDDVTASIAAAVQQARERITTANNDKLTEAISAVEASAKEWVSAQLDDYYTIAKAEAQIEAFRILIGVVPEGTSLQDQIDAIALQIADTKEKVTEAYQQAIKDAIEKCEGTLTGDLAEKIQGIRDNELKSLYGDVDYLEGEVSKLLDVLSDKEMRIQTLDGQVAAIRKSLEVLDELETTLKDYIEAVEAELGGTDADNLQYLTALISSLSTSHDGKSLKDIIDDLGDYVGTIPTDDETISAWIESSFSTFEKEYGLYATIGYVEDLYKEVSNTVSNHSGRLGDIETSLSTIIEDSKSTIDGWITEALSTYMDASTFDGRLSLLKTKLEELFADGDDTLIDNISTLSGKISSTINDELTEEYKEAIGMAISDYNGFVTDEVKKVFDEADGKINTLDAEVSGVESTVEGIQNDIKDLKDRIISAKNDISTLLEFIKDSGFTSLKDLVEDLKAKVDAIPDTYASLSDFNTVNVTVTGEGGYASIVAQLSDFSTNIAKAEGLIDGYTKVIGDYKLSGEGVDNLKSIMDSILNDIKGMKDEVKPGSDDGLRGTIEAIIDGNEDILSEIDRLEDLMLEEVKDIASIVYIPESFDGMASFSRRSSSCTLEFEVRPMEIASAVAKNSWLYYVSSPTRAIDLRSFSSCSISGDNKSGVISATGYITSLSALSALSEGISAVLVVEDDGFDFASEFVPISY